MILFKEDWGKYPDAVIHYSTNNKSFLRFAGLLKAMGIENNAFPLQLHNPLLLHVDPHSPNLTREEKLMVVDEVSSNFFYYIREVAKIDLPGSPDPSYFLANRGNIATFWLFFNYITTFLEQIRQTGKSATINQLIKGVSNYMGVNTATTVITKDNKLREDNTADLQKIESYLPPYLKRVTQKDMDSTDGITVKSLGNKISIKLAQKSVEAAKNLNRGSTDVIVCVDEVPYLYNIDISLPVALSAGTRAIRAAKKLGQPAGILMYTSAGYMDTKSGAYAYDIYKNGAKWSESLYDMKDREELEEYVKKHSTGRMDLVIVEMNHKMLGLTDEWLKDTLRMVGASKLQAMVEFLNIWVKGGSDSLLPGALIDSLYQKVKVDSPIKIVNNGFAMTFHVSEEELKSRKTILSIDMSELLGNDSSTAMFVDVLNGGTLASGHYGKANISQFGLFVFNTLRDYPNTTLMIERNSMGIAILDQLAILFASNNMNIFKRVFNTAVDDGSYILMKDTFRDMSIAYTDNKEKFGFRTSAGGRYSRDSLYGKVVDIVEMCLNHICDKVLIEELGRIEIRKGRIDHKAGEHDDMVIAFLLAHWLLRNGKYLHTYGINPSTVLTAIVRTTDKKKKDELEHEQEDKRRLVEKVDALLEEIKRCGDTPIILFRLEAKLRLLKSKMSDTFSKSLNIQGRLNDIVDEMKRKK